MTDGAQDPRAAAPASSRERLASVTQGNVAPAAHARLPMVAEPDSKAAASFRLLRYRLLHQCRARVIAISSPERCEGKTTCAVNLAVALAEQGEKNVLLVEANLRNPAIAGLLGLAPNRCLVDRIRDGEPRPVDQWEAVSVFFPNLHVLAADPATSEPELLSRSTLLPVMKQLEQSGYAHIVLDCPSTLESADMSVVADCADGIFLTALATRTRRAALRRAAEVLAPAPLLGTVVMGER